MKIQKNLAAGLIISFLSFLLMPALSIAAVDELVNGSFEQQGTSSTKAYDWQDFGTGYTRYRLPRTGQWSIRVSLPRNSQGMAGAYQRVDFQQAELKPVFIGGFVRGVNIVNNGGYFGASLYAEIHMMNGQVAYWNSIANFGTFNWRFIGFNTGNLSYINQPIDYILVIPILSQTSGMAFFDDITVKEYTPAQGAVTLMFDDGTADTYSVAKPMLDAKGYKGTAAVISGEVGQEGFMNAAQAKALQTAGWEIVSHSVSHDDMTAMSETAVRRELVNSKSALARLGLSIKNFALPFGAYNAFILAEGAKSYRSIRAFEQGSNAQGVYPFDVKVRGVKSTTTLAEFQSWLDEAKNNKRWLVLTYHTITNTGDDEYHTPPAQFAEMLDLIVAAGMPVITYDQGLTMFGTLSLN